MNRKIAEKQWECLLCAEKKPDGMRLLHHLEARHGITRGDIEFGSEEWRLITREDVSPG